MGPKNKPIVEKDSKRENVVLKTHKTKKVDEDDYGRLDLLEKGIIVRERLRQEATIENEEVNNENDFKNSAENDDYLENIEKRIKELEESISSLDWQIERNDIEE